MKPTLAEALSIFVDSMITAIQSASHDDERTLVTCQAIEADVCATYGVEIVCETLANHDRFYHAINAHRLHHIGRVAIGGERREWIMDCDAALYRLSNSGYAHSF